MYALAERLEDAITEEPTRRRALHLSFILGMVEFRSDLTTGFFEQHLQDAYDCGRDLAHRLTFRRFDK